MHSSQLLSLILTLSTLSSAAPSALNIAKEFPTIVSNTPAEVKALSSATTDVIEFVLSDITTETTSDSTILSFTFLDQNSNTSTICSQSFNPSNTTSIPTSYIPCNYTETAGEFFAWYLKEYTDATTFELQLAHEFSDPVHYPPPYNYIEYFGTTNVSLICGDDGVECVLADDQNPLPVEINGMSN